MPMGISLIIDQAKYDASSEDNDSQVRADNL
ncbi:hypothetical protein Pse7367_2185 [Thalassoporum mexicanum PCC 7367]|nr:hypothetical protein Pse7367_2185 [Pseudanabaena sp. PCC 7367]